MGRGLQEIPKGATPGAGGSVGKEMPGSSSGSAAPRPSSDRGDRSSRGVAECIQQILGIIAADIMMERPIRPF